MSVLFPEEITYGEDWQQDEILCRPAPVGGCVQLIKYDRFLSNRLSEYDRFERFIDVAKLVTDLTLNDIYDLDRYFWLGRVGIMGVTEEQRFAFENIIYPEKGMTCAQTVPPSDLPLPTPSA